MPILFRGSYSSWADGTRRCHCNALKRGTMWNTCIFLLQGNMVRSPYIVLLLGATTRSPCIVLLLRATTKTPCILLCGCTTRSSCITFLYVRGTDSVWGSTRNNNAGGMRWPARDVILVRITYIFIGNDCGCMSTACPLIMIIVKRSTWLVNRASYRWRSTTNTVNRRGSAG